MWPFSKRRKPEQIVQPTVEFVGEQDGPPERELKAGLASLFATRAQVSRAYLCRVRYTDRGGAVALAVVAPEDARLAADIGQVFRQMFGPSMFMDIMFLDSRMETRLASVCKPFYTAG